MEFLKFYRVWCVEYLEGLGLEFFYFLFFIFSGPNLPIVSHRIELLKLIKMFDVSDHVSNKGILYLRW